MMKKLTVFLLAIFALSMIGCSKDAEISAFLTELETVTNDMSAKIEAGDVDGAKAAFDAKKDSLKKNWEELKNVRGFQVSEETTKKMEASMTKNGTTLSSATAKGIFKISNDKAKADKLSALMKEYGEIFKV